MADTFDATRLTNIAWTCVASAGSACTAASGSGDISGAATVLAGGTLTYTITASVLPGATGNLVNTATVAAPGGISDPDPANNTATDTDTPAGVADLAITKTDGSATYLPGGSRHLHDHRHQRGAERCGRSRRRRTPSMRRA